MFVQAVLLSGEIGCWSLLELKHGSFNVYLSRQTYIHKRYLILNSKSSIFVDFFELTHYKTSKIK